MQYVVIRPLVSIAGIICQALNVLCENDGFSLSNFHFAYPYIEVVDTLSITIALYGLIVFYVLTRTELTGRRPLAKFLCIKLIVFFTFYQSFVVCIMPTLLNCAASELITSSILLVQHIARPRHSCYGVLDDNEHYRWAQCACYLH